MEELIKAGADVRAPCRQGDTPIHYAAAQSHHDVIEVLAKAGSPLELKDKVGAGHGGSRRRRTEAGGGQGGSARVRGCGGGGGGAAGSAAWPCPRSVQIATGARWAGWQRILTPVPGRASVNQGHISRHLGLLTHHNHLD